MFFPNRQPGSGQPLYVTLIWINVVCFCVQILAGWFGLPGIVEHFFALNREAVTRLRLWEFFTYMFLHANLVHLLVNMFMFHFAGREVESTIGRTHLARIYFGGGLVGGLAQVLCTWTSGGSVVGASAGVFAVLIAFTTLLPEVRLTMLLFFVVPLRMKARHLAYGLVALSVLMMLTGSGGNVAHIAHLGGCLTGWLYARRLGAGGGLRWPRFFGGKRPPPLRRGVSSSDDLLRQRIDAILDKILREGMHSLTPEERRILERGRHAIARRDSRD